LRSDIDEKANESSSATGNRKMNDNEIRGLLLRKYYERRRDSLFQPKPEDFSGQLTTSDILAVSAQLAEHGLIDWRSTSTMSDTERGRGLGKITAAGIDVVEGAAPAPIAIRLQNVTVQGSPNANIIVGDSNTQNISANIEAIIRAINEGKGTDAQKADAKSLLKRFVDHPLVAAIAGGLAGRPWM
jgi:hypothetical protein